MKKLILTKTNKIILGGICMVFLVAISAVAFLYMCRYIIISNEYTLYYNESLYEAENSDYILVPGARISPQGPLIHLQDRLDTALTLYKQNPNVEIIVSGALAEDYGIHECDVMFNYLVAGGIPENKIIIDYHGISTFDTIFRAKEYVGDKSVIVCTQEMYAPRAIYIAHNLGLNASAAASDIHIYSLGKKATSRELLAQAEDVLLVNLCPVSKYSLTEYPYKRGTKND